MPMSAANATPRGGRGRSILLASLAAVLACVPAVRAAEAEAQDGWSLSGDLRAGYFGTRTTARDGTGTTDEAVSARLRGAIERRLDDRWRIRMRAAARFSDGQDGVHAYLRGGAPTRTGARFGDATLDEAYLGYAAPEDGVRWRIGRFQAGFPLAGVASKALDRNDGASLDVTWTDGLHVDVPLAAGWRGHAIVEHRPAHGWTGTVRAPLDFSDDDSRASLLVAVENPVPLGAVTQRVLTLSWMPSAVPGGTAAAPTSDYGTVDAKVSAGWPIGTSGRRFAAGAEVGHAFGMPRGMQVGTGETGRADGLAWQLAASLHDIAPGHHLGLVHGQVGAGWLVSPDFRGNERQTELRYQWRVDAATSVEARVRRRTELRVPAGTRARVDDDAFVRITRKF